MAPKTSVKAILLLSLNLLCYVLCTTSSPSPPPPLTPPSHPPSSPSPPPPPTPPSHAPSHPSPPPPLTPPSHAPSSPSPPPPSHPPSSPSPPPPSPAPSSPSPTPPSNGTCPINTLQLGVCANLLGGVVIGNPGGSRCCTLIRGLVDLEAAVCLCTAIRANILGINLNLPISLSLILNACGKTRPTGFTCP